MAANAFDYLLEQINDETDRETLKTLGGKYKEVKDGYLRQSDYSKRMNELAEEKKQQEAEIGQLALWRDWRKTHWVDDVEMTVEEKEARDQLAALNTELETLKAAQEAGMTFDEVEQFIEKNLSKKGVVTRADLDGRFVDAETFRNTKDPKDLRGKFVDAGFYKADSLERINSVANGLEYLYEETYPLGFQHKDEFNEILPIKEVVKFANENGFRDIVKAYDTWVSPKRAEIAQKKNADAIAAAREEGRVEALKNNGLAVNGKNPADQGPPVMSHLQRRLQMPKDKQEPDIVPDDMELGKGVSMPVAQQYRKDLAEGKVLQS